VIAVWAIGYAAGRVARLVEEVFEAIERGWLRGRGWE
jgi:hypothetical protein